MKAAASLESRTIRLMVLISAVAIIISWTLAGKSQVLVDEKFANTGVARSDNGKANDKACDGG